MDGAVEQGNCHLGVPEASGPPHRTPPLSISEFPPLLSEDSKTHGRTQSKKNPQLQDRNNNMSTSVTTRKELNKKKFRPAENFLLQFSFSSEVAEPSCLDSVRADVLHDLEVICQEYSLPDWNYDTKHCRKTRGKLGRSYEDRYIRGRLGVLPPGKAKRWVNFRLVSRKNKLISAVNDNRENRKKNTEKKLKYKGLKRGIGNERYRIDIGALNDAMPHTATQQRARRNANGRIVRNDDCLEGTAVRPTTIFRKRRNARWKSHCQNQERHQFELHHDNITCLAPDIKNEDDLWQLMNIQHRELTPEDYDLLLQLDESIAPKTVSEETLSNLRVATVGEAESVGSLSGQLCSICIEEYSVGEKVKYLPCNHFYHEKCIDNWLTYSDSKCPLDGYEIS